MARYFRHADWYFIWDRIYIRKCMVYRWKWLEDHVTPPPKPQFRGQGIHTTILPHDLRDGSLENTSGPSFELHNSNYPRWCLICIHTGQNTIIRMTITQIDHSNCAFLPSCENPLFQCKNQNTPLCWWLHGGPVLIWAGICLRLRLLILSPPVVIKGGSSFLTAPLWQESNYYS